MFMVMSRIWATPQPEIQNTRLVLFWKPRSTFEPRNGPPKSSLYQISRIVLETEIR